MEHDTYIDQKDYGKQNKMKFRLKKRDYKNRFARRMKYHTDRKTLRCLVHSELNYMTNKSEVCNFMLPSTIASYGYSENKICSNNF
jgi:hypothetical protein